jgi:hypothetical protein
LPRKPRQILDKIVYAFFEVFIPVSVTSKRGWRPTSFTASVKVQSRKWSDSTNTSANNKARQLWLRQVRFFVIVASHPLIRGTRLIVIKVMRVPGNPLINGTFWLDEVNLTSAQTPAGDH